LELKDTTIEEFIKHLEEAWEQIVSENLDKDKAKEVIEKLLGTKGP